MIAMLTYAGLTDRGRVRDENQDRWFGDPAQGLFLVCDGIGGALAGDLASRIVAETLPPLLRQRMKNIPDPADPRAAELVRAALAELSDRVRNESKDQPGLDGMGTTVVLALVRERHALIAHLGDSRAYLFRGGHLERLTKDHSIVQLLVDHGEITPEGAVTHSERGRLTRYIGMDTGPLPEACCLELRPGDRLLLCSDGLTDMLSDEQLLAILAEGLTPQQSCQRLISAANMAGGKDNITAVVVSVGASDQNQRLD